MRRTKLSLTFSYIQTFIIHFTKIDPMVGTVVIVIMTIIMMVTLVNSTMIPILTPIRIISLILGIILCTIYYPLVIGVIPTFMSGMGLATNLALNNGPLILLGLYLWLGLTYIFTSMLPFCDASRNCTPRIAE